MHLFRLCGRVVEVCRYQVDYTETSGESRSVYCPTRQEADAIAERTGGAVTAADASAYAWMDGLEMPDVPDTYAEAIRAYELGQAEAARRAAQEIAKRPDQLRADLDYILLMEGL